MKRVLVSGLAVAAVIAILATAGCTRVRLEPVSEDRESSTRESAAVASATSLDATLRMGAGELRVDGGAPAGSIYEADLRYRPSSWEPEIRYTDGELTIEQPSLEGPDFFGNKVNEWEVRLTEEVPVDLTVEVGAGEADLDLSTVDVRDLTVRLGAGDTTIDLSGERTSNVAGDIEAGAGTLTIRVPSGVGVRIEGRNDGLGTFEADGFSADGNAWVNDEWDTSTVRIELNVQRGIGDVRIETVD